MVGKDIAKEVAKRYEKFGVVELDGSEALIVAYDERGACETERRACLHFEICGVESAYHVMGKECAERLIVTKILGERYFVGRLTAIWYDRVVLLSFTREEEKDKHKDEYQLRWVWRTKIGHKVTVF